MHTIKAAYKRKKQIDVKCDSDGNKYAMKEMNAKQLKTFDELLLFAKTKECIEEYKQIELSDILVNIN